jgi:hypothetical protein
LSCTGTGCGPGLVIAGDPYPWAVLLDFIGRAVVAGAVVRAELPDLSVRYPSMMDRVDMAGETRDGDEWRDSAVHGCSYHFPVCICITHRTKDDLRGFHARRRHL